MAGDGIDDGERIAEKSIETIDADEDIKWNVGGIKRKGDGWANNPENVKENSIERGIAIGRFLPLKYFVERAYKRAQGKVEKIENELKTKYGENLETFYIDSRENNPTIATPEEALAWDYSVNQEQLRKIEEITYENRERIEESARLRGDKENPLAVIRRGIPQVGVDSVRGFAERISGRNEQNSKGEEQGISVQTREGRSGSSFLKSLLRQERGENPVIWASIVLAKEILLGKPITNAKLEKLLPADKFDGTKRQYALDRAHVIAEHCKATQENYRERLDQAVRLILQAKNSL